MIKRNSKGQFIKGTNKFYGKDNPYFGKTHSKETRDKLKVKRQGRKPAFGKTWTLNKQARENISKGKMGNKNPAWKGGITVLTNQVYNSYKYSDWRQQVFIRDRFTCKKCGQISGDIQAHHKKLSRILIKEAISYMPLLTPFDACLLYQSLWDINNGLTLCGKCHKNHHRKKPK